MNQMCVNGVYANDNCNGYECIASINNYASVCEKVAVGQNVSSNQFTMIFPESVGESTWRLVFYPKGQYVDEKVGDSVGIYLIMLSCEQKCKTLKANVEFELKSQTDIGGPVKKKDTIFNYAIPSKRWIGEPDFFRKNWLNAKRRTQFCCNDCLVIRCLLEEAKPEKSVMDVTSSLDDPVEQKVTSADEAAGNKSDGNQIRLQNGRGDDRANNCEDWSVVGGRRANKKQCPNQVNARCDTHSSEPKKKRKAKPKKGGKRKK